MTQRPPVPGNEPQRLLRISELSLLESSLDPVFERVVELAAAAFQVPIALISTVEEKRQFFRASVGLDVREMPRLDSFCAYTILADEPFQISDALSDSRFANNPIVTGEPNVRFYAGVPLTTTDGLGLGSVCIIDTKPRPALDDRELAMLKHLAGLVMQRILTLRDAAIVDQQTGLFNRVMLEQRIRSTVFGGEGCTVAAVDVIPPLFLNDIVKALGYRFSDELILTIKERLQAQLPQGCTLYKISPTRFAFLLDEVQAQAGPSLYQSILDDLAKPVISKGIPIQMQAGIGVLPIDRDQAADQDWLRLVISSADDARDRQIGWQWYDKRLDDAQQRAFMLLSAMTAALQSDDQLYLVYQPRIDLNSGRCESVEALLRWTHPVFGPIGPAEFIPLAEKTALIGPISLKVMHAAVAQAAVWQSQGISLKVGINISATDLESSAFTDELAALIDQKGLNPSSLELEFTETALINKPQAVREQLDRISELGIKIAIDDFGSGYSNWTYLRDLPATTVKIDQTFMHNLHTNEKNIPLVQAVIELASRLGYRVVAEGIEDAATLELLQSWGCHEGQGYHIARPMLPGMLRDWLAVRPS
ncbi:sensor domain-containing phosphodiesterase [Halopseudomonas salina]|uniref:Sensor domain-containing phosphodiesterase n=1 Tax=Halopseudomonas salina TaxID=1323744 RepID=A0ABQ1P346_9GAMM|nr:GGDEF and EAL domain-containing protein [Halopseudomonas salina]GGC89398.1 sensor domain-containing phosphodiesterase [Halopseudomonas salina]